MSKRSPPELVMIMLEMLERVFFNARAVGSTWFTIRLSREPVEGYGSRESV
jgi:hypothetical protein